MQRPALKVIALATLLQLVTTVHAAGLGKATAVSAIGRPLRVEVDITRVRSEELMGLEIKLASAQRFSAAGLAINPALHSAKTAIKRLPDGRLVAQLTTEQSINDTSLDFILDMESNQTHVSRQYTVLLNPPIDSAVTPPQAAASAAKHDASTFAGVPEQERMRLELARELEPAQVFKPTDASDLVPHQATPGVAISPASNAAHDTTSANSVAQISLVAPKAAQSNPTNEASVHQVARGETLWKIAKTHALKGATREQMILAIFLANKEAFTDGNMNRLAAGVTLTIPSTLPAETMSVADCVREIRAQWEQLRQERHQAKRDVLKLG